MQRRRFKNTLTFPDRLAKEAERFRQEAETKPPGQERDDLLTKAHAAEIDKWVSSPGLAPTRQATKLTDEQSCPTRTDMARQVG